MALRPRGVPVRVRAPGCSETLEVELKELATLHAEDGYCVARGHAVEGVDELVDARPRYDYVRTID